MEQKRNWQLSTLEAFFALVYALGAVYFFMAWLGKQSVAPSWRPESLPLDTLIFAFGAVSVMALFKWKRWGVYGLLATWVATMAMNILFPRDIRLAETILALLLVAALLFELYRARRSFR